MFIPRTVGPSDSTAPQESQNDQVLLRRALRDNKYNKVRQTQTNIEQTLSTKKGITVIKMQLCHQTCLEFGVDYVTRVI